MHIKPRSIFSSAILILILGAQGIAFKTISHTQALTHQTSRVVGRWRVKFILSGVGERDLIFQSQSEGLGSFQLLNTEPEHKSAETTLPALWSQATNDRVNFSSEVELKVGTCCREIGTLILKGKFNPDNSIGGNAIFISTTEDQENFNGYRSMLGTFSAKRILTKD
jgi:hypothetical protein